MRWSELFFDLREGRLDRWGLSCTRTLFSKKVRGRYNFTPPVPDLFFLSALSAAALLTLSLNDGS